MRLVVVGLIPIQIRTHVAEETVRGGQSISALISVMCGGLRGNGVIGRDKLVSR